MIFVTTRYVRIGLEQAIYDRARQAAEGDRRSLANWIAVTVERALTEMPEQSAPGHDDDSSRTGDRP